VKEEKSKRTILKERIPASRSNYHTLRNDQELILMICNCRKYGQNESRIDKKQFVVEIASALFNLNQAEILV
jgi:hypothetical protein